MIIWATCTGFIAVAHAPESPVRKTIGAINPQLATLFIPIFAIRLALYLRSAPWREWVSRHRAANAAALGHGLLYLCVSLVLVSGFLMMPHRWALLGVLPMPVLIQNEHDLAWLSTAHGVLCTVLAGLVAGHVGAVLWHQIIGHPVLNRMTFHRAARPAAMETS